MGLSIGAAPWATIPILTWRRCVCRSLTRGRVWGFPTAAKLRAYPYSRCHSLLNYEYKVKKGSVSSSPKNFSPTASFEYSDRFYCSVGSGSLASPSGQMAARSFRGLLEIRHIRSVLKWYHIALTCRRYVLKGGDFSVVHPFSSSLPFPSFMQLHGQVIAFYHWPTKLLIRGCLQQS